MSELADRLQAIDDYVRTGQQPPLTLTFDSPERKAIREAEVELRKAENIIGRLRKTLTIYADPDFYVEMVPSRALDDGGLAARNVLLEMFPE